MILGLFLSKANLYGGCSSHSPGLDGKIVAMDPLAEDYLYNMRSIARIKEEL